jgi:hypothetical protein
MTETRATKSYIESRVNGWLPSDGETCFRTLDGADVAAFLARAGFHVVKHYDTGRNGEAITECGLRVSTNGRVSRWS